MSYVPNNNRLIFAYLFFLGIIESWIFPIIDNFVYVFLKVGESNALSDFQSKILDYQIIIGLFRSLWLLLIIYSSFLIVDKYNFSLIESRKKNNYVKGILLMVASYLVGYLTFIIFFIFIRESAGIERADELYNNLIFLNGLINSQGNISQIFWSEPLGKFFILWLQRGLQNSVVPLLSITLYGQIQRLKLIQNKLEGSKVLYPKSNNLSSD